MRSGARSSVEFRTPIRVTPFREAGSPSYRDPMKYFGYGTLLTLDSGRVEVFGHDVERDEMAVKRLINRVSVDAAFFKKLSPHENLLYAARLYGLKASDARREAERILARLGIAKSRLGSPLEQMSRGMQQKVAIARALLSTPMLLLLDEPSLGLAPQIVDQIFSLIAELRQQGLTILLVEQNAEMSLEISDRGYVFSNGQIELEGSREFLKSSKDIASTYLGMEKSDPHE